MSKNKLKNIKDTYKDYVILDDCATKANDPLDVVDFIKPDFFIKGPDYANKHDPVMRYREKLLKSWGGEAIYYPKPKIASRDIIKYIREH